LRSKRGGRRETEAVNKNPSCR